MYDLLKEKGLKDLSIWADNRKSYHTEFRLQPSQTDCTVIFDFGYVRHIESIHLCSNEIVLEGKWSDMKLNVRYDKIKSIEVEVV
jgi:hypothetical protein